jgi:hypothetical protein
MASDLRPRGLFALIVALLMSSVALGCDGSSSSSSETPSEADTGGGDAYAGLRRPLDLPELEPGDPCPTSESRHVAAGVAAGLGSGPVYPIGIGSDGVLTFQYPPAKDSQWAGSGWGGSKVLWAASARYRGPILIRGGRLDRRGGLRFDGEGGSLSKELRLPANKTWAMHAGSPKGWRYFPSQTRLQASGCYAYQVDGTNFSRVIVFRSEAWLPVAFVLGAPGCRPPSPLAAFGRDLPESAGRLSRASVWALFFPPSGTKLGQGHRAVFRNLVGRNMKVVFRVTGSGVASFAAIAPDGSRHRPIDGPTRHGDSTWDRPGDEWGMVFRFDEPGCWRLQVSRRGGTGDAWLVVR